MYIKFLSCVWMNARRVVQVDSSGVLRKWQVNGSVNCVTVTGNTHKTDLSPILGISTMNHAPRTDLEVCIRPIWAIAPAESKTVVQASRFRALVSPSSVIPATSMLPRTHCVPASPIGVAGTQWSRGNIMESREHTERRTQANRTRSPDRTEQPSQPQPSDRASRTSSCPARRV